MKRLKQLDLLRALAIFLVLGRHLEPCPVETSSVLHAATKIWATGGWIGVDLFFVLSGFLVSGLLFREHAKHGRIDVPRFLIRRGFKIYPAFWLLIAVTVALWIPRHHDVPWQRLAIELCFVQNYVPGLWVHTWSLAVEEHFYLLLAAGFVFLTRRRASQPFELLPRAFVLVALICQGLRLWNGSRGHFEYNTHLFATHLRIDSLFFGVLIGWWFHQQPANFLAFAQRYRLPLALAAVVLLAPAFCWPVERTPFLYIWGPALFYLGGGGLLVASLGFAMPASRWVEAIAYGGSHSYSIYLWNGAMMTWGTAAIAALLGSHNNWLAYAILYLALSVGVGILMSLIIEFPVLRIRERLFPSLA